jgi:hypothetical protein
VQANTGSVTESTKALSKEVQTTHRITDTASNREDRLQSLPSPEKVPERDIIGISVQQG